MIQFIHVTLYKHFGQDWQRGIDDLSRKLLKHAIGLRADGKGGGNIQPGKTTEDHNLAGIHQLGA